ncbi:thiamine phosphate synthase [Ihuprevotella massiliensis]|uniref:thiamine phosphate synthase n=1 Tax=Ihuprevotella massiliensis TaxID=1852368 RepID=UPI00094F024B
MHPKHHIVITAPELNVAAEGQWISALLRLGIGKVHIRKPQATADEIARLLENIPQTLRHRCILSEHSHLVRQYHLGGLHLSVKSWQSLTHRPELFDDQTLSVSCHSVEELHKLPFLPDYAYLSPVAKSLSKPGYGNSTWTTAELQQICAQSPCPFVALGGIQPSNANHFLRLGFTAVASLGHWQGLSIHQLEGAVHQMCSPRLLLCGGIDPTCQAGITADVRHAERLGACCFAIPTAITQQNSSEFLGMTAVSHEQIIQQFTALQSQSGPDVVKIGLVASLQQLQDLCAEVREHYPHSLIIWDPILRTSSGYDLLPDADCESLQQAAASVDLLLPNRYEQTLILGELSPEIAARRWNITIVCKGIAHTADSITDRAYLPTGEIVESQYPMVGIDRHGTGCLYGTTLAFHLANGVSLSYAMSAAQRAVAHYRSHQALPTQSRKAHLGHRMFITHASSTEEVLRQTEAVLSQGRADIVQLRMKNAPKSLLLSTAREIQVLCRNYGVPLLINDHVDVARAIGADGVHLGKEDMSPSLARELLGDAALIGRTCNTQADLQTALCEPIDYVGVGPYRFTQTKERLAPILGIEGYRDLHLADYPLSAYAIGGIRPDEAPLFDALGIYGIAMSGALIRAISSANTPSLSSSLPNSSFPLQ